MTTSANVIVRHCERCADGGGLVLGAGGVLELCPTCGGSGRVAVPGYAEGYGDQADDFDDADDLQLEIHPGAT